MEYKENLKDTLFRMIIPALILIIVLFLIFESKRTFQTWWLLPILLIAYLPNVLYSFYTGIEMGVGGEFGFLKPVSLKENPKKFYTRILFHILAILLITVFVHFTR